MQPDGFWTLPCNGCGRELRLHADLRGKVTCYYCKNELTVGESTVTQERAPVQRPVAAPAIQEKPRRYPWLYLLGTVVAAVLAVRFVQTTSDEVPLEPEPQAQATREPGQTSPAAAPTAGERSGDEISTPEGRPPPPAASAAPVFPPAPVNANEPAAALPPFSERLSGPHELTVENPNRVAARVAIRHGRQGKDFIVQPASAFSAWVPPGELKIYVQSMDGRTITDGQTVTIQQNGTLTLPKW